MQLDEHGAHETKQGIFIGEDANYLGAPLQFLVQTLDVVGCAVIASQANRELHNRHGTFETVIQARHGSFCNLTVVFNNPVADLPRFGDAFAVEHLLKLCAEASLVFLRSLVRDVSDEMELAPLPRNIWENLSDGGQNALVCIRGNHHNTSQAALFQPHKEVRPSGGRFVSVNAETEDFTMPLRICTVGDHEGF